MADRRRSWWGWGYEDEALTDDQATGLARAVAGRLDMEVPVIRPAPDLDAVELPQPRIEAPEPLESLCSTDRHDRAGHAYGKAYRDVVRASYGRIDNAPDVVAHPRDEADVVAVMDWCGSSDIACIPYGGGSSVVGGVEADVGDEWAGVVTVDLTGLDQVIDIDPTSRAARIQGGALGPGLEAQLRPDGYTLRHFPQSFEFSTLGGWLATRSGGHYATVYTHIDDLVESMRVVTPQGIVESRRLPGSGAGPSPDRLFLGSEGSLGVITEAWMRIQDRPVHKASAAARFEDYDHAVDATRALSQSALFPTNCRLLDAGEAATSAGVDDGSHLLIVGFESADHPVGPWMDRAAELVADHGGRLPEGVRVTGPEDGSPAESTDAAGAWRNAFIRAPYGRDALVRMSVIAETFETACTWDRFPALHAGVTETVTSALAEICGGGWVTCRFTHVYPDGPAPYFSVIAPARPGSEIDQWDQIKAAASEALIAHGGTITHHHAVGRVHRDRHREQQPDLFAEALRAVKGRLDPAGVLNPGVIA